MNIWKSIRIMSVLLAAVCGLAVCIPAAETSDGESEFDQFAATVNETLIERMETLQKTTAGQHSDQELLKSAQEAAEAEYRKLKDFSASEDQSDDKQSVISTYLKGVKMQAEGNSESAETFLQDWETGYYLRASALMEMEQIIGVKFSEAVRPVLDQMGSYTGTYEREGAAAWFVQGLLALQGKMNTSGIDGNAGTNTRRLLREFLSENEAKVPCAIINERLLTHLAEEGIITEELFDNVMNVRTGDGQTIKDKCADADPSFAYSRLVSKEGS